MPKSPFPLAYIDHQILLKGKIHNFIPSMNLGFFTLFEMSLDSLAVILNEM